MSGTTDKVGIRLAPSLVYVALAAAALALLWTVADVWRGRSATGAIEDPNGDSITISQAQQPLSAPPETPLFQNVLSMEDAVFHNGIWFVLDIVGRRVHRLASDGTLLGSFGRDGSGPGEFRGLPTAIGLRGDTIIVTEHGVTYYHLYSLEGVPIEERLLRLDACLIPQILDVASAAMGLLFLVTCTQADMRVESRVLLETSDGFIRTVATRLPAPDGPVVVDLFTPPLLSAHPHGFVFGNSSEECLSVYDTEGEVLESVCHDWLTPMTPPRTVVNEMETALAGRFDSEWVLPDRFFPFVAIVVTSDERWIYRVLASDDPESYELVIPDADERIPSVPRARYVFAHEESILAGWEDIEGTRIAIYPQEDR